MSQSLNANMKKAVSVIRKARKVIVASHINPDGDTIGCLLALGLSLLLLGKRVILLCQDKIPARFQFLPGSELVLSHCTDAGDVSIAVDCGSTQQLGNIQTAFFRSKTTIQVDHHDFGNIFGKIQVLDEEASAVGEIVYELIRALKVEITPAIATCLLTSIIVDTGSFRFSNVRPETFEICSKLIKKGVNIQRLIEDSYWKKSIPMVRLSGFCLLHTQFSKSGAVAWSTVTQADLKRFGAKLSDADSVADDMRSIEGVRIAIVFRETDKNRLRVSLRSSQGINVANIARFFGGGGHHNSAGCSILNSKKEIQKLLTEAGNLAG